MGYTLLKVTAVGIVLRDYHERRLTDSPASRAGWRRVAAALTPGVWAVWTDADGRWHTEPRAGSRLYDGIVTRQLPSPIGLSAGVTPKPRPPCAYDAVRQNGTATLLTDPGGAEIYEACVAAVVGWDGHRIVLVPAGRPRVWSTAEWAVREHLAVREAPIQAGGDLPLLLLNAVKGCCEVSAPGRLPFPAAVRREIEQLFDSLTLPCAASPPAPSDPGFASVDGTDGKSAAARPPTPQSRQRLCFGGDPSPRPLRHRQLNRIPGSKRRALQ